MHLVTSLGVFTFALGLFAYIPGRLILRLARIVVAPLDELTLSLNLGLILSACFYWLFGYLSVQEYFVFFWPLAVIGTALYFKHTPWLCPTSCIRGPHFLLVGTILLGVLLLAVLPIYYSNMTLTREGALNVCPLFDAPFHAAIAQELTHSIPPQNPIFSGQPLSYHVGADLPAAMFSHLPGLDVADLTFRLIPSLFYILTLLSVFCFSRLWLASAYGAALLAFLVVFGEDLSFLPGLLQGSRSDWSAQYFGVPSTFSLFSVNPMLPALGFLFGGFYCLLKSISTRAFAWQLFAGLLFAAVAECKIFTALHLALSLMAAAVLSFAIFRKAQMLRNAVFTSICMAPIFVGTFLSNSQGSQIAALFFQSRAIGEMGRQFGITTQSTPSWIALILTAITVPTFLVGSLGLRVIGLPAAFKEVLRPKKESSVRLFLALFIFVGIIFGMVISIVPKDIRGGYDNGVWFYVQSKYVAWTFAVESLLIHVRNWLPSRWPGIVVIALFVALSIPSAVQHFVYFSSAYRHILLSPHTVGVLQYLKDNSHPGEVVLSSEELAGPILALTECHIPVGNYAEYMVPLDKYQRRIADLRTFWIAWNDGRIRDDILRTYGVNYVVLPNQQSKGSKSHTGMVMVCENVEWIVCRVGV